MSYPDSVRFLYSLGNELKVGAKFGLERMQALLSALGNPESGQRFVHVAGTNGKGSTSAAIASVLREAGFHIGLYTSPHLQEPTERIQIDGIPVSPADFSSAFNEVHAAAEQLIDSAAIDAHPSYFETVTAMAFLLFRNRCDWSVIEVGLGGRLDATNVIVPQLTVITPISFDHEIYLGNTLEQIAFEKAGILKPGVPAVVAQQSASVLAVLQERAAAVAAPVILSGSHQLSDIAVSPEGTRFFLDGQPFTFALAGRHQADNAVTAILACKSLDIDHGDIESGLKKVRWPGRLELLARAPDIILDGAHNPAGAEALANFIQEVYAHRPVWIVYGAMRDKAIEEVTSRLFPIAQRLILTAPKLPRALRPEAIAEIIDHPDVLVTQNIEEAMALVRLAPPDAAIFFTGSLFVVGEARQLLRAA